MTIFYDHVKGILQADFLLLKYLRKLKISEKNHWQRRGYINKTADISVTKGAIELKLLLNDCYDNIL